MTKQHPHDEWERQAHEEATQTQQGGRPTTGDTGPGGAPTGLRRASGVPERQPAEGPGSVASGGAPPVGPSGASGTSAGGLAEGPAGIGGARNLPEGAGHPSEATRHAESDTPVEVTEQGRLRRRDGAAAPDANGLEAAQAPGADEPEVSNRIRASDAGDPAAECR